GGRPQSLKAGTDSAPPSLKHPHQLFNRPERPFGPGKPAHRATPADSSYPSSTIRPHRPASIGPNPPNTPPKPAARKIEAKADDNGRFYRFSTATCTAITCAISG